MVDPVNESDVEEAALSWFKELGYAYAHGPHIAPEEPAAERESFSDVLLLDRLRDAIDRINPDVPADAREDALRRVLRPDMPTLVTNNRAFHRMLRDGVTVEYQREDGVTAGNQVHLIDYDNPDNNDWLVVNQFTVIEGQHNRRPDVVVFVNGMPLVVIELKNAADEDATIWTALNQLQTYKQQIPSLFVYNETLFVYNETLIVSDGLQARMGSLTAGTEWFKPWRTIEGESEALPTVLELEVLIRGVFQKDRFLELLRHFIVFEHDTDSDRLIKIVAGYHQLHAARAAVEATVEAASPTGDKRCSELLRQSPVQAESVAHLRELLQVASGVVVFTTIQKFLPDEKGGRVPQLSDRHNIIVIADEAHRSQYDMIDGLARNMRDALPSASFIGFIHRTFRQRRRSWCLSRQRRCVRIGRRR